MISPFFKLESLLINYQYENVTLRPEDVINNHPHYYNFVYLLELCENQSIGETLDMIAKMATIYDLRDFAHFSIMHLASHPSRPTFNRIYPRYFKDIHTLLIRDEKDMITELRFWISLHGSKKQLPTCIKKIWAKCIIELKKNGLPYSDDVRDLIRISHCVY